MARRNVAAKGKDTTISLVLYAPRFGQPLETGFQSPEFLVIRNSPEGILPPRPLSGIRPPSNIAR